ncbi:unnamed protein product [Rotaria magnacalcarata]|uniref:Uncharacterized protein n=1 Tax=Rotaria magnacalcarata TaxID=392030 RepID=A0A816W1Q2_9BILA|nr:unnamed protein product [Rotaria magnacalcarata]CAF2127887.1 unnamed protein product [Rotaria magnacalcarata]
MHFNTHDGLLYKSIIRFSKLFQFHNLSYYIVGGYALIFHGVIRNTMDIDIIIAETDFQKAKQILMDVGYTNVLGDNLCVRFEHECFLPVDLFTSPLYGPDPSKTNTTIYEEHIIFCNLPGKFSNIKGYHYLVSAIVLSSSIN